MKYKPIVSSSINKIELASDEITLRDTGNEVSCKSV